MSRNEECGGKKKLFAKGRICSYFCNINQLEILHESQKHNEYWVQYYMLISMLWKSASITNILMLALKISPYAIIHFTCNDQSWKKIPTKKLQVFANVRTRTHFRLSHKRMSGFHFTVGSIKRHHSHCNKQHETSFSQPPLSSINALLTMVHFSFQVLQKQSLQCYQVF